MSSEVIFPRFSVEVLVHLKPGSRLKCPVFSPSSALRGGAFLWPEIQGCILQVGGTNGQKGLINCFPNSSHVVFQADLLVGSVLFEILQS